MGIVEDHFALLKARQRFGGATLTDVPNGTYVVKIPDFRLPEGWSANTTTVYFIVPVGYPVAKPDTFWTDGSLRLRGGGVPMSTGGQHLPGLPPDLQWFSWHPSSWNPNRDNLLSYVAMIANRFREPR